MNNSCSQDIEIASTDEDILATWPVMRLLRPDVPESEYLIRVRIQEQEVGFHIAALRNSGEVVCVAGFRLCRSLGWGKFLYVDDLVTQEMQRSQHYGSTMFAWLTDYARQQGCVQLRLDSAVYRHRAHRFYLREGMDILCFHFGLALEPSSALLSKLGGTGLVG